MMKKNRSDLKTSMWKSISRSRRKSKFINLCNNAAMIAIVIIEQSNALLWGECKNEKVKRIKKV